MCILAKMLQTCYLPRPSLHLAFSIRQMDIHASFVSPHSICCRLIIFYSCYSCSVNRIFNWIMHRFPVLILSFLYNLPVSVSVEFAIPGTYFCLLQLLRFPQCFLISLLAV
ncbi:hypothetical protein GUJ93_ZPchr0005g15981 [Zizania palustris]|uniref:Uncharacterized protein n=1 Tax=Zizania palustris TaxID=103762 RepID=A0A8J5T5M4_ZIZPA|nr:hypothetical protein GUJ93_ZPchr0005g15981 [Zizania palustris]